MAEEDFGIALVEAQGVGCPVIAYARGGASEVVIPNKTGLLLSEQSANCLVEAVIEMELRHHQFNEQVLWENACRFNKERFRYQFMDFILQAWLDFQKSGEMIDLGGRRGTIPQPSDPQSDALPIELRPPRV